MSDAQSAKLADDLEQPEIRKCDSWKHQLRGYHFALPLRAACLYMGMGSGKSKIAVDLIMNWGHRRVLTSHRRAHNGRVRDGSRREP
jgi:excinuclease UvrABC ATPase subunit